jgi:hypothetical protein
MLPRDYVASYVELAYAATAHGVQGDTVPTAHVVIGEHTGAASAYVGMTRGRTANTAHLVAADLADARDQWIAVFVRDRADLGPGHAAELAAAEAARYAETRPLDQVLADLHQAWEVEQRCTDRLALWGLQLDILRQVVAVEADHAGHLARLATEERRTTLAAERAQDRAEASARMVAADTARHAHHRAERTLADASRRPDEQLAVYGPIAWACDPQRRLADLERDGAATGQELGAAQARIARLTTEPALLGQPVPRLAEERDAWRARRDANRTARQAAASPTSPPRPTHSVRPPEPVVHRTPRPGVGPGLGR